MNNTTHDHEAEAYAEFVMSWVHGGGSAGDAPMAWATGIAHANGYTMAPEGNDDRPYYMDMTEEEREADNLLFEMGEEGYW